MVKLCGKVAIVTGSSTGIGAATAIYFAQHGAAGVTITGRKKDKLEEVKSQIEKAGSKAHVVVGDITDSTVRKQIVDETLKAFGKLNILVNNAGAGWRGLISEANKDDFDAAMNLNVWSVIHITSIALPHLKASKGAIVNVSSVAGMRANAMSGFYGISKAALDQMTKSLAQEVGPEGVRVNSVNPGALVTNFFENLNVKYEDGMKEKFYESVAAGYPLRRTGEPEEVAAAIAFLASDESKWTTGITMPVDGGHLVSGGMPMQQTQQKTVKDN